MQFFFLKYCTSLHVNSEGLRERDAAERIKKKNSKKKKSQSNVWAAEFTCRNGILTGSSNGGGVVLRCYLWVLLHAFRKYKGGAQEKASGTLPQKQSRVLLVSVAFYSPSSHAVEPVEVDHPPLRVVLPAMQKRHPAWMKTWPGDFPLDCEISEHSGEGASGLATLLHRAAASSR